MADDPPPRPVPPPRSRQNFEFKRTYLRPAPAASAARQPPDPHPATMGPPPPVPIKKRSSWRVKAPARGEGRNNNTNGEGPSDDEASPNGVSGHGTSPVDPSSPSVAPQQSPTKVGAPPGRDGRDPLSHLLTAAGRVRSRRSPKGGQPKAPKKKPAAVVSNSKSKLQLVPAQAVVAGTPGAGTVRWQAVGGTMNYMRPVLHALEYAEDKHGRNRTARSKKK